MHPNTKKALALWVSMYTEEELEILKLTSGAISVDFVETLVARYANYLPRGGVTTFKAKCLKKVVATKAWIYKLKMFKDGTFQDFIKNPRLDYFKKRQYTTFGYDKGQEILKNASVQHEKLSRDFSKTASGHSEMAQEIDRDSLWTQDFLNLLSTGKLQKVVNIKDINTKLAIPPTPPEPAVTNQPEFVENTFFQEDKRPESKIKAVLASKKEATDRDYIPTSFMQFSGSSEDSKKFGDNTNEKLVFKEANITNALKGFNTADVTGREAYSILESGTRGRRIVDNFSIQELMQELQRFDPADHMERYLQKFDCLFVKQCL